MKKDPKVFLAMDEELAAALIKRAERTVMYAAPSVSTQIADAILRQKQHHPSLKARVIVDPDADVLRLGYGEIGGIKMLRRDEIDVRSAKGLRIGVLLVDDRSWIFTPTPKIILDEPTDADWNAVNVTPAYTKWLLYAIAPDEAITNEVRERLAAPGGLDELLAEERTSDEAEDDEILDEEIVERAFNAEARRPQIGEEPLTRAHVEKMDKEIEARPPKQFDAAREILVYNSYLQFVEMSFVGGRLSARTIRLPEDLLRVVGSPDTMVQITATCKLFENIDNICPEVKEFETRVSDIRRCFTVPLGHELGSVVLTRNKMDLEKEVKDLHEELVELTRWVHEKITAAIQETKARLFEILLPLVAANPPDGLRKRLESRSDDITEAEYLDMELNHLLPRSYEIVDRFDLRCTFKDVTWEMLNEREFGDAIRRKFPKEEFTRLYAERNTIAERQGPRTRPIGDDDWPDQIDNEPTL